MAHLIPVRGNLPVGARAAAAARVAELGISVGPPPDKHSTTILSYPINVEGDPQQGHYISFYIRVQNKAKLKAFKQAKADLAKIEKSIAAELNARAEVGAAIGLAGRSEAQIREQHIAKHGIDKYAKQTVLTSGTGGRGIKSNSIQLARGTTVRLETAISLYMPPSVQVSYESKYGDQEIGVLAETGYQAIKDFQSGASTKEMLSNLGGGVEMGVKNAMWKILDTAAPGAKALFAISKGKVITPKMELMFEGIGRRNFSYSFVFIPKSEKEARVVHNIAYQFKYHMASNYAGGGVSGQREMEIPSMFDIEYMHIGEENSNLNKIATCVLTKMDVEYGGDRYVAYEGGVPQTTKLSLNFTEMEIITKDHIAAGF